MNQAETAIIQQGFAAGSYRVVDYRESPDVVIVNTCTVTANGDADTRRFVNKVRRINPAVKIALVGCQAQVQKANLLELPNVHWVVGNQRKFDMESILRESPTGSPQVIVPSIKKESFTVPFTGFDKKHTRANLKVQDGCDFFCSFCEIPYARGRARSREFEDILKEAEQLANAGHHELVLTGINIGTYNYRGHSLLNVIDSLEDIEDLWRIRVSSIEPTTIAKGIVKKMAAKSKLCRYLHIPIQSGSDQVLSAMKRQYSVKEFVDFFRFAYDTVPEACFGTDVIVGFPGETEAMFRETYNLLLDMPFTYFHVFSYSQRDHAKSGKQNKNNVISKEVIAERSRRLRELSNRKRKVYFQKFLGNTEPVLFEQQKKGIWSGVTDTYIRVQVKTNVDIKNQLLPVRLELIDGQVMVGKLV